jgi:ribosome-associated heat shock protein Hsp15
MEETRVDRWLWAVRQFKTRTEATKACAAGHVTVAGRPAKPATPIRVGDRVVARVHGVDRDLEVVQVIDKRVGAPIAAACLVDHTPPPPPEDPNTPIWERDAGAGRPTKRDRRQLDRLRGGW